MKTKKIISILFSVLMALTSFPVTAFADDNPEYLYDINGYIIAESDVFKDYPDIDISASYKGTEWSYNSESKALYLDSVDDKGTVAPYTSKMVPTGINYFEIYDIERIMTEYPEDYNDYISMGYTDEEIYEEILDTTTDENGNVYHGLFKSTYVDLRGYIEHITFGPKVQLITDIDLYDLPKLESVDFVEGNLNRIGAIFKYTKIDRIELPSSVSIIENGIFKACTAKTIDISKTDITVIPQYAFQSTGEVNVILNDKIRQISEYAFESSGIKHIDLPNSVNVLSVNAFSKSKIESIDLSKTGIDLIYDYAFWYSSLKEIKLNNKIKKIGKNAFSCTPLEKIVIPSSVKIIDSNAFSGTSNLEEVTLTDTETIGDYAFYGSGIKRADLSQAKISKVNSDTFGSTNIDQLLLPVESQYTIEDKAFYNATIGTLSMPNVRTIRPEAFLKARIKNLTIPSTASFVTKSFYGGDFDYVRCEKTLTNSFPFDSKYLKTFVYLCHDDSDTSYSQLIGQSDSFKSKEVTVYGYTDTKLYQYCADNNVSFYSLDKELVFPLNADEAANGVSTNVENLENTQYGTWTNGTFELHYGTLHFYGSGDMESTIITDNNGTEYTITEYVTANGVSRVNLHDGITAIPDNFLYVDDNTTITLNAVYLPYDLKKIGDNAFRKTNIATLISQAYYYIEDRFPGYNIFQNAKVSVLPEHVRHIGKYAFAYTTGFKNYMIMMPNELTNISEGLFCGSNVSGVYFIKNHVSSIGKKAFADCQELKELELSFKITDIYEEEVQTETVVDDEGEEYTNDVTPYENNAFGFFADGSLNTNLKVIVGETETPSAVEQYCNRYGITVSHNIDPTEQGTISTSASGCYFDWKYYENSNTVIFKLNTSNCTGESTFIYNEHGVGTGYYRSIMANSREEELAIFKRINYFNGIDNLPVIGSSPYSQSEDIARTFFEVDKIIVEDGVERICASDVFAPFNPKSIELPDSLKYLDYNVFGNCNRLEGIVIPDSVIEIGSKVFNNCPNLKYVNLGNGIEEIPTKIFYNCKSLQFVDIGTSVTHIQPQAFYNCTALEEIIVPDNVTTIDSEAFYNCIKAQSITIGKSVTWIDENAFSNSVYCENIIINSDKLVVDDLSVAFKDVGIYTNGITVTYGKNACKVDFRFIKNLKVSTVVIGKNTDTIKNVRYAPSTIEKLEIAEGNTTFTLKNGCILHNTYLVMAPRTAKSVNIPTETTAIGIYAFNNSQINSLSVPKNVKYIHAYAFSNCTELKSISLGKNVEVIDEGAFMNDDRIRLAYFPENVMGIGDYAFKNCTGLANVTFVFDSTNLGSIGVQAFCGCTSLKTVVLPQQLREIKDSAFIKCNSLEAVYIWNTTVPDVCFTKTSLLEIYTLSGSSAHAHARTKGITFHAYTDEDLFLDECLINLDEMAGYVGYCENGHGNIEYLTVYEADCEHEGYTIGVCQYCSEILEEVHVPALGHSTHEVVNIPATATTRGFCVEKCANCGESFCSYSEPTGSDFDIETHIVRGYVTVMSSKNGDSTNYAVENVNVIIDGMVVATTNGAGAFTLTLETGTYEATLKYTYGISRKIYIVVEDEDIVISQPISIIACDFNKDSKIDDEDMRLFSMVISSGEDDVSYLRFVDLNNDKFINGRDQAYIRSCIGIDSKSFEYETLIIQK